MSSSNQDLPDDDRVQAPPGSPPKIPKRTSSKRANHDDDMARLQSLKEREGYLANELGKAKKKLKPNVTFGPVYWNEAAVASGVSLELLRTQAKIASYNFNQMKKDEDSKRKWWSTQEARRIVEGIKAATYEKQLYEKQAQQLSNMSPVKRGIQALFNTSMLGINAQKAGFGKRGREQAKFKSALLQYYDAASYKPGKKKVNDALVFDTATGLTFPKEWIKAAHIIPYKMGPDLMQAYFGDESDDLMTVQNGLLLYMTVEQAMDDGAITIVPDIPLDPTMAEVEAFHSSSPKNFRWRVVDSESETLDKLVAASGYEGIPEDIYVRDLDGTSLHFRNDNRPRARYLYWIFCVAMLRLAWKAKNRSEPTTVFKNQLGKAMWATLGRYLSKGFLVALAAELGHNTTFSSDPDDVGILGIAKMIQSEAAKALDEDTDEDEDEEADEDDNEDN